jgi:drug/metabolite transporter (DMT)-like permease
MLKSSSTNLATRRLPYIVMMLLAGSSFGFVSPVLRIAYSRGYLPRDMTNLQYAIAFLVLWLIVLIQKSWRRLRGRQLVLVIALGITNAATSYCYYLSLTRLPASIGIILLFQFAWMVVVIDIIVRRRLPGLMKWLGLLLIFIGTFFSVGFHRSDWHGYPLWAIGLGLLSALSYALTVYLSGIQSDDVPPIFRSAAVITVALLVTMIPFHPTYLVSGVLTHGILIWGVLIAIFSQIIPMVFLLIAVPHIGGRMAAVLGTIELPVAIFGAWLFNGDHVTISRLFGILLILGGIIVSETGKAKSSLSLE